MEDFGPETYGERVADVYDEWLEHRRATFDKQPLTGASPFHVSVCRS